MTAPPILRLYQPADRRPPDSERPRYTGAQGNPAHIPDDCCDVSLDELRQLFNRECPTPQATIEAIMYCVRARGVGALKEPRTWSGCRAAMRRHSPRSITASRNSDRAAD
jgi:hypothetical protein